MKTPSVLQSEDHIRLLKTEYGIDLPADLRSDYNRWARKPMSGTRKPTPGFIGFHRMVTSNCLPPKKPAVGENPPSAPVAAIRHQRRGVSVSAPGCRRTRIPPLPEITVNYVDMCSTERPKSQVSVTQEVVKDEGYQSTKCCSFNLNSMPALLSVPDKNLKAKATRISEYKSLSVDFLPTESTKCCVPLENSQGKINPSLEICEKEEDRNLSTGAIVLPSITKTNWSVAESEVASLKEDVKVLVGREMTLSADNPGLTPSSSPEPGKARGNLTGTGSSSNVSKPLDTDDDADKEHLPCKGRLSVLGRSLKTPLRGETQTPVYCSSDQLLSIRSYCSTDPHTLTGRCSSPMFKSYPSDISQDNSNDFFSIGSNLVGKDCRSSNKLSPNSPRRTFSRSSKSRIKVEGCLSRALNTVLGETSLDKTLKESLEVMAVIGNGPRSSSTECQNGTKISPCDSEQRNEEMCVNDKDVRRSEVSDEIAILDKHFKRLVTQFNHRTRTLKALRRSASTSSSKAYGSPKRNHRTLAALCSVGAEFPDPSVFGDHSLHFAASIRLQRRFSYKDYGTET